MNNTTSYTVHVTWSETGEENEITTVFVEAANSDEATKLATAEVMCTAARTTQIVSTEAFES